MKQEAFLDTSFYRRYRRYYTYIEPVVADPLVRGYFTLVASIFLIAFFLLAALSPTFSTILGLVKKIDDQKKTIAMMDAKINSLVMAQENYALVEPKLSLLDKAIPVASQPDEIFKDFYRVASASGLVMGPVSISDLAINKEATGSAGALSLRFVTNIAGNQSAVDGFLKKIEMLPRIMRMQTISYGATASKVDLSGVAYYYEKSK